MILDAFIIDEIRRREQERIERERVQPQIEIPEYPERPPKVPDSDPNVIEIQV